MILKHINHKHGGVVTSVSHIGHETYKKTVTWFFIANVEWSDGTASQQAQVPPAMLCCESTPAAQTEYNGMQHKLSVYLRANGTWSDRGNWVPNAKTGRAVFEEV